MSKYNLCECSDPGWAALAQHKENEMESLELLNDQYGHCGECHEVHYIPDMVAVDGYYYCKSCSRPTQFCNMCADDATESDLFAESNNEEAKAREREEAQARQDSNPAYCPICDSGDCTVLDILGKRALLRCNECGVDFSAPQIG